MRVLIFVGFALCVGCGLQAEASFSQSGSQNAANQQAQAEEDAARQREMEEFKAQRDAQNQRAAEAARQRREATLVSAPAAKPQDPIAAWIAKARIACSLELSQRACGEAPAEANDLDKDSCRSECKEAVVTTLEHMFSESQKQCVAATSQPECKMDLPAAATINRDLFAAEVKKCGTQCAALRKEAATDAKDRERASKIGDQLVTGYRKCMLAEDRKREAIVERIHDPNGLYADRMQAAAARCRQQNQCDWLEAHSDEFECTYGD